MANQIPESMDKAVRVEMMRLLRERVANPTLVLDVSYLSPGLTNPPHSLRTVAATQLLDAEYLNRLGLITLAGMDYFRRETTRFRWARENWFPVFVAVLTSVATLGAAILSIWFGNRPC